MLDIWDYITFAVFFVVGVSALLLILFIAGLPGRIALARKHPEAQAVTVMGWAGLPAVLPWIQAFIWAFKPTNVVDLRRYPPEEQKAIDEEWLQLMAHRSMRRKKKHEAAPRDGGNGHHGEDHDDEKPPSPH